MVYSYLETRNGPFFNITILFTIIIVINKYNANAIVIIEFGVYIFIIDFCSINVLIISGLNSGWLGSIILSWYIININIIGVIIKILNLNFSFDAILLIYVNRINNPPIIIKNVIIENQDVDDDKIIIIVVKIVWINKIDPIEIGVFIIIEIVEILIIILIIQILISSSSLIKTLVLGT